jgi:hypothetical protein
MIITLPGASVRQTVFFFHDPGNIRDLFHHTTDCSLLYRAACVKDKKDEGCC